MIHVYDVKIAENHCINFFISSFKLGPFNLNSRSLGYPRTRSAQPSPKPQPQSNPNPKPKRNEMPANSEVLKMLLDEESGRNGSGVAAMSELQEDRNAQSNSGFSKPS